MSFSKEAFNDSEWTREQVADVWVPERVDFEREHAEFVSNELAEAIEADRFFEYCQTQRAAMNEQREERAA